MTEATKSGRVIFNNESLNEIAKGTGIAFIGLLGGFGLAFFARILIARIGTEAEYGVFSLGFVIVSIVAILGTLGFEQGLTRSIAFARGENDYDRVRAIIPVSIQLGLVASTILGVILYCASDILATQVFNDGTLGFPLRILAFAVPFYTLMNVHASIFRGFDDVKPKVFFQEFMRNALFILLLLPVLLLDLSFNAVFYAFSGSLAVTTVLLIVYTLKRFPFSVKLRSDVRPQLVAKELLLFSLPLVAVAMLQLIIVWIDTLMLGSMRTSVEVGLYNAAHPLTRFVSIFLVAIIQIYMPIASGLYGQGNLPQMRQNYSILTKWISFFSIPVSLILILFPETILTFLFGKSYVDAADALRILTLGFTISNLAGPNLSTLIAMGKVKFVMWISLAIAILNIVLNFVLIPHLGIEGAAIASAISLSTLNVLRCTKLYSLNRVQPLSKNLVKPVILFFVVVGVLQLVFNSCFNVVWWMLPLLLGCYYCIYGLAILLTKSIDREDLEILAAIEQKTGIKTSRANGILSRLL